MNALGTYLPFLLTALVMTTATAAYKAPKGMVRRTSRDAFLLNLTTHPAAVVICIYLGHLSFYGLELAFIAAHACWYHFVTGLEQDRAVRVSVLSNVIGQLLGNLVLVGLWVGTR